jgi:hypothetical protein
VDERAKAHLAVVDEWAAALGESRRRGFFAGSVASVRPQAALGASIAIEPGFDVEERARVELVGRLAAASDVADRCADAEDDSQDDQRGASSPFPRLSHGRTS